MYSYAASLLVCLVTTRYLEQETSYLRLIQSIFKRGANLIALEYKLLILRNYDRNASGIFT